MFYIYGLVDPIDKRIRYIGQTGSHPETRLLEHLRGAQAKGAISDKDLWLKRLLQAKVKPTTIILQICDSRADALDRERAWIETGIASGWELVNAFDQRTLVNAVNNAFIESVSTRRGRDRLNNAVRKVVSARTQVDSNKPVRGRGRPERPIPSEFYRVIECERVRLGGKFTVNTIRRLYKDLYGKELNVVRAKRLFSPEE